MTNIRMQYESKTAVFTIMLNDDTLEQNVYMSI
jgi:hypothetical protein